MAPGKQTELKQSALPHEHHKHTVVRLARIQSHLATSPRTGKLKGKVAIITGVGSLKGIGYTSSNVSTFVILTCFVGGRLHYLLLMKVGRLLSAVEQRQRISQARNIFTSWTCPGRTFPI
jgi:hypothetical protein